MAAVLSALGQSLSLMHTAELGNLDEKEYSVYLNSSIIEKNWLECFVHSPGQGRLFKMKHNVKCSENAFSGKYIIYQGNTI